MISGLYAITNEDPMPGEALLWKTEAALQGGCRLIQYRNKRAAPEVKVAEATALRSLCSRYDALLIINDSPELAAKVRADGVHLGQSDASPEAARQLLGPTAVIGRTCHASLELAAQAKEAGVSYLAFGRFFNSQTKPEAPPAPLELLQQARRFQLPLVAIGGINRDNAALVVDAGADCVAISHELFSSDDPAEIRQRARFFTSLFSTAQELS